MQKINISAKTLNIINQNRSIMQLIQKQKYMDAYKLIMQLNNKEQQKTYYAKIVEDFKEYINNCFNTQNLKEAKNLILKILEEYPLNNKKEMENYFNEKLDFYLMQEKYKNCLIKYDFYMADELFSKENTSYKKSDYEKLKGEYIKKYFSSEHNIDINDEQAIALSNNSKNILIRARAGSGKTRTIACKSIYAIEKENYKPEEILILAFNKDAAKEIRNRIIKSFNYKKINQNFVRTFHSFAHRIVGNNDKELLYNDSSKYSSHNLTNFIERLYHSNGIWNDEFKNKLYLFYTSNDELVFDDEYWKFQSLEEKYRYLRSKTYFTLNGERVKSYGEKFIANFLFEHNIKYKYEQILTQKNSKLYKPDFSIYFNEKKYVLEHWGIDENDINKTVPKEWTKSWDTYKEEMDWKRNLLQQKIQKGDIENFLETSIIDLKNGFDSFEKQLKFKLENLGIVCTKLSHTQILDKMEASHKFDVMAEKFAQFIQAAKKSKVTPNEIETRLKTINISERSKIFISLANKIYKKYDTHLLQENKTDFDNILEEAINIIHETKGNCEIQFEDKCYKIKDLKLIMIDEYQDFSRLFFELIQAIKTYNSNLKLFCVGDDWQAINGFAGSDVKYFNQFVELFEESEIVNLTYNYRSGENVVKWGNSIMRDYGIPAKCYNKSIESKVCARIVDKIDWDLEENHCFLYDGSNFFDIHHRYLKACFDIIKSNQGKSFIIMDRTNYINNYHELDKFHNALRDLLAINHIFSKVETNTIHQFKGQEADNVIILGFTSWYPFIHPDNEFYFILGRTPQMVLDEERRLFYVAVTRAKQNIYFVHEGIKAN